MNLEENLKRSIVEEATKHIERFHGYHNLMHVEHERNKKRLLKPSDKIIKISDHWHNDKKFNPFYVRGNAAAIAKSISKKITDRTYKPNNPIIKLIQKPSGGTRNLTIFQIPDAAVSNLFYKRLLQKNRHRFSSFSYAYRNDRNVHFAIQDISVDLTNSARTYIAEFDFSDFFGSIQHEYLYSQFDKNGFFISPEENTVIRSFLDLNKRGIPQGTSISLFLANFACWSLDQSLEKAGLKFARYSDDTVIWSPNYESICKSFILIDDFSKSAGVKINAQKSGGINLLTQDGMASEISAKKFFDFLGYSIGPSIVSIRKKSEQKIKRQIAYIIYKNLIQPLQCYPMAALIIPANNKDPALLTTMMQIRRFLYGGLLSADINEYLKGRRTHLEFKGIMSFYPLLNDEAQLAALDGWLLSAIHRAVQKRSKMLLSHKFDRRHSFPFCLRRNQILDKYRRVQIEKRALLEVPSFKLIYRALKKGLTDFGIEHVMHPDSTKYDY